MPLARSILKVMAFTVTILLLGQIPIRGVPVAAQFNELVATLCRRGVHEVTSAPWYASVSQFSLNPTMNAPPKKTEKATAAPTASAQRAPEKLAEDDPERIEKTPIQTIDELPDPKAAPKKAAIDDSHIQDVTPADRESLLRLLE